MAITVRIGAPVYIESSSYFDGQIYQIIATALNLTDQEILSILRSL